MTQEERSLHRQGIGTEIVWSRERKKKNRRLRGGAGDVTQTSGHSERESRSYRNK